HRTCASSRRVSAIALPQPRGAPARRETPRARRRHGGNRGARFFAGVIVHCFPRNCAYSAPGTWRPHQRRMVMLDFETSYYCWISRKLLFICFHLLHEDPEETPVWCIAIHVVPKVFAFPAPDGIIAKHIMYHLRL